jgi:hypothetical protein
MTMAEIREQVPVISEATIRDHLRAGRNTKQAMLSYSQVEAFRKAGKKSARVGRSRGWGFA